VKRSAKSIKPPGGIYSKSESATANLREAKAIAANETYPAFVAARFALVLAILSFIVSAAALAVAVAK
jgi:hypothetical protein